MTIKLLTTGGTVDKVYNHLNGELCFETTNLPSMLKQARCNVDLELDIVMLKDSLYMVDTDRKDILKKCRSYKEDKIIITHGTDTMAETAKFLGEKIKNKTIVLVGAMIPYSFGKSDALFNLGCAISAVQHMPKGVYITMNGKIFPWNNVMKNKKFGEFNTIK